MAKKVINGQNGQVVDGKRCSFSTFYFRVSRLLRALPYGFEFVKDKSSFTMIRTYLDPYSGMAMIGCEKDDSVFSVSAAEVYSDESHVQLLDAYDLVCLNPENKPFNFVAYINSKSNEESSNK